ncbi:MAG: hypothetical protein HRT58_09810 [Crocinitomicaceae bacterium]|nr:hypothetical protein [Flavobacteriales bacterium]NQZ35950.1 hypothetical protein [Crocinitomicaceae bacterium]
MNQNDLLKFSFVAVFAISIVLFEKWYSKYRTEKIKIRGLTIIPQYGFMKTSDDYSDYQRKYQNYAASLNHIRKNSFFNRHALRLLIDFTPPTSFIDLQGFIKKKQKKHPKYTWVGNTIFFDIKFTNLNASTMKKIEFSLNEITTVLISEKIKPISRTEGRQQGEAFENWQDTGHE